MAATPPALPSKGATTTVEPCASPSFFSPSSDKRFWSNLRSRVDTLLENRQAEPELHHPSSHGDGEEEEVGKAKRLRQDTALLLRGFDSVAHTLSQLSSNIDNALQGAKDLTKPPTITDIFQSSLNNKELETPQSLSKEEDEDKGKKRKLGDDDHPSEAGEEGTPADKTLKKAKNLAVSMAAKASFLAKQLKSIKSDLSFMQERCALLEEENEMLRHGYTKGIRPEEDDLVRLQLEALLSEKSRLANENANLSRENQCLRQLVEYHQATSQDLSATYEEVINGICLDFSSPPSTKPEEPRNGGERNVDNHQPSTSSADQFEFSTTIGKCCDNGDQKHFKGFLKYSP
uniref:Uncharacterized protein n=1 Tax=Kalanchoe fedtschenkoi TaxID=63787 RepID=A0A7N0TV01_KALFE